VGNTGKNDAIKAVMAEKRHKHTEVIERFRHKDLLIEDEIAKSNEDAEAQATVQLEASSQVDNNNFNL
jgi:hypothetical protein